jgi:serine incorporator 1/3
MPRLDLSHIRWQMIFALNSMLAWLMKTRFMIELIEKWSYDYIKMDCEEGKCYGVLAVSVFSHRCLRWLHRE